MRRIVLTRPAGARNVGAALRAAANFGPAELWVVAPELRSLLVHPEFEQGSHGVEGAAAAVQVVETTDAALADCTWAVGFTGRLRDHHVVRDWREEREGVRARCADPNERVALLFGNETNGLVLDDCERCNLLVRLPTGEHPSINLATTVALALWDTFDPERPSAAGDRSTAVTGHQRAYLLHHVRETLMDLARSDQIRIEIGASVERLFARFDLETRDTRAWHAIMRALGNKRSPLDYGLGPVPDGESE